MSDSLGFDHITGLSISRVWDDGEAEVWFHMSDGTAVEISADEDGGFSVFIHASDSPLIKEIHEHAAQVH